MELIRLSTNKNLKDYGKEGLDKTGQTKKGFIRLPDNRIVKESELHVKSKTPPPANNNLDRLKDYKGFGLDKNGNARKGFVKLESGKVVSKKELESASKS